MTIRSRMGPSSIYVFSRIARAQEQERYATVTRESSSTRQARQQPSSPTHCSSTVRGFIIIIASRNFAQLGFRIRSRIDPGCGPDATVVFVTDDEFETLGAERGNLTEHCTKIPRTCSMTQCTVFHSDITHIPRPCRESKIRCLDRSSLHKTEL